MLRGVMSTRSPTPTPCSRSALAARSTRAYASPNVSTPLSECSHALSGTSCTAPRTSAGIVRFTRCKLRQEQPVTWMSPCPVGTYGSGFGPPANRSAIHWIMSFADGPITPAWLCPGYTQRCTT